MGWGSWLRGAAGAGRGKQQGGAERLPDQAVLAIVAEQLAGISGKEWTVADGLVKGPGSTAVRLGDPHSDDPHHLDLVYLLDVDRPEETAVVDCVAGFGAGDEAAVRRGVEIWASTTAVTLLELLAHSGRFAGHVDPRDPDGFPGWHAIHGGIVAWGVGDRHHVVQDWTLDHPLLPKLAPALAGGLPRKELVGVKLFFGGRAGDETAEVRVAGEYHEAASRALAELDWPRVAEGAAYARTFVLLVHPAA